MTTPSPSGWKQASHELCTTSLNGAFHEMAPVSATSAHSSLPTTANSVWPERIICASFTLDGNGSLSQPPSPPANAVRTRNRALR